MVRRTLVLGLCAAALACTSQKSSPSKSGPVVARGDGVTITADEFKARLEEQSPFIRGRYTTLERKKEFLDNLIRFEVLAKEAERQGLADDPEVRNTLKKIMVQKLVQKNFHDATAAADLPEPELQRYYEEHRDEYSRPKRVRVAAIAWDAQDGSAERARKLGAAQKVLARLKGEEGKNPLVFGQLVAEHSEDAASKAAGGDLQFKTKEELEKAYSNEVAEAAFALRPGELSGVVQAPQGLYILRYTAEQPEVNRSFEQVKTQIANKLHRERRTKEFDEWLKGLRDQARITVDEKALEAIEVASGPAGGAPAGHGAMAPAPAPAAR
jgi:peptidyl-prolyl cis-trans isomerase C